MIQYRVVVCLFCLVLFVNLFVCLFVLCVCLLGFLKIIIIIILLNLKIRFDYRQPSKERSCLFMNTPKHI